MSWFRLIHAFTRCFAALYRTVQTWMRHQMVREAGAAAGRAAAQAAATRLADWFAEPDPA